jgi:NAD(P)-dependent dehydrogenase (short-subunit alcohol dehydrogenase family)
MGKLDGKVAAITGSTRSIGRGIAEAFLAQGASVVINGRSDEKGRAAMEEMGGGDRVAFWQGDAMDQKKVEGIVDFAVERYGKLDIMVLNSGGVQNSAPVALMTDEEWNLEITWNLNHVFWGMRKALNHMIPRQYGRIIAISSVEGKNGKPGIPGYNATKHAVCGLVKSASKEVGTQGITVNAILPGLIITDIVNETGPATAEMMGLPSFDAMVVLFAKESAIKRPNTVQEVGAAAVLFASDVAAGITGCMFPVDGGTLPY